MKCWVFPLVPPGIWFGLTILASSGLLKKRIGSLQVTDTQRQISISTWPRQLACVYFRKLAVIDQRDLGAVSVALELVSLSLSIILNRPWFLLSLPFSVASQFCCSWPQENFDLQPQGHNPSKLLFHTTEILLPICMLFFFTNSSSQPVCLLGIVISGDWIHGVNFLYSWIKWHEHMRVCVCLSPSVCVSVCGIVKGSVRQHKRLFSC